MLTSPGGPSHHASETLLITASPPVAHRRPTADHALHDEAALKRGMEGRETLLRLRRLLLGLSGGRGMSDIDSGTSDLIFAISPSLGW